MQTVLAERQLRLGQSVILDSMVSTKSIRLSWRKLAKAYQADWKGIECVCSGEALHRARLENRQRGIPDWHGLDWAEVVRVAAYYVPWQERRLILDTVDPLDTNIAAAVGYLTGGDTA